MPGCGPYARAAGRFGTAGLSVLGQARSTQHRRRVVADDEPRLVTRMIELAPAAGRYGYRRITAV